MAQRKSLTWVELRVGLLVIASFAALAIAIFFIGGETGFLTSRYEFTVYFSSAEGLKQGAEVWLEGVTVGNVKSIRISNSADPQKSVEIILSVDERFKDFIGGDSTVVLKTIGLLGDQYVDIARRIKQPAVQPGGSIQGAEQSGIAKVITGTNDILANMNTLSEQFRTIVSRVDRGEGTIGKFLVDSAMYDNANTTVKEAAQLVKDARTGNGTIGRLMTDDALYARISQTLVRIDGMIEKVERGQGTLGRFVNDDSIYTKADQLVARFQSIAERIDRGEGTLGKLTKDDAAYNELRTALNRVNSLLQQLESGEGTAAKLIKDPALYNTVNQTSSEILKLMYDFRQNPKKYLTINFKLF